MQPLDYAARPPGKRRIWLLIGLSVFLALGLAVAGLIGGSYRPRVYVDGSRPNDASHLRQIGQLMVLYANDHHGQYPDRVESLLADDDDAAQDAYIFVSPYSNDTPATAPTTQAVAAQLTAGGHLSYVYCGRGLTVAAPANAVLAYGPRATWGCNVLFGDGHVESIPPAKIPQVLSELAAGHNPPRPLGSAAAP